MNAPFLTVFVLLFVHTRRVKAGDPSRSLRSAATAGTGGGAGAVGGDAGGGDGGGGGIGGEGIGGMCEPSSSLPSYVAHPRSYIPAPGTVRFASMTSRAVTLKPFAASVLTTWTNASCSVPSTPSADAIPPLAAAADDPVNHAPNVTET